MIYGQIIIDLYHHDQSALSIQSSVLSPSLWLSDLFSSESPLPLPSLSLCVSPLTARLKGKYSNKVCFPASENKSSTTEQHQMRNYSSVPEDSFQP